MTCVDISTDSTWLACGYSNGTIILWDVVSSKSLKVLSDIFEKPVCFLRFRPNSHVLICADQDGSCYLVGFNKIFFTLVVERHCLLTPTTGKVTSISFLPVHPNSTHADSFHRFTSQCVFSVTTTQTTFTVILQPNTQVIHKSSKPITPTDADEHDFVNMLAEYFPIVHWGWAVIQESTRLLTPTLVRTWGKVLQLFTPCIHDQMKKDQPSSSLNAQASGSQTSTDHNSDHTKSLWTLSLAQQFETPDPIIATMWLEDHLLVYMSNRWELSILDTQTLTRTETIDMSSLSMTYIPFSVPRQSDNESQGESKAEPSQSQFVSSVKPYYFNSFSSCDKRCYMLGQRQIDMLCAQSLMERAHVSNCVVE